MKRKLAAWIALGIITVVAGVCLGVTNEITKGPIEEQVILTAQAARQRVLPSAETFEPMTLEEGSGLDNAYIGKRGEEIVGYVGQATVNGYGGAIEIIAGVGMDNKITGASVGGANFSETAGLGAKAKDPKFTDQFAQKQAPLRVIKAGGNASDSTIDAITAATITSSAVTSGVNKIASYLGNIVAPKEETGDQAPVAGRTATADKQGYHGPVAVTLTVDDNNVIVALTVGDENFAETEGIGTQVKDEWFVNQFLGKTPPVKMDDIDVVSGATISSEAVVKAINAAFTKIKEQAAASAALTATAEKQGYHGPVAVTLTVNEDGTIAALTVGDENFAETEGIGTQVKDEWFVNQFIGKTLPVKMDDIDVVSGATISSEAVVKAINAAYTKIKEASAPTSAETTTVPAASGNVFSASRPGYGGPVAVTVTFGANGEILALTIGNDNFAESEGYGTRALTDEDFQAQFIGKVPPLAITDIDALTAATVTSEAVVNAINRAHEKMLEAGASAPAATEAPAQGKEISASRPGYGGPVAVTVTFGEKGEILALTIGNDNFAESEGYGTRALTDEDFQAQFIGKIPPLAMEDIDALTAATVTSEAVVNAINRAYEKLNEQ